MRQKGAVTAKPNSFQKKQYLYIERLESQLSVEVYYHFLRFKTVLLYRLNSTQHDRVWAAFGSEQIVLGWC